MRLPFKGRESGASLVELMMGLGILAIIGTFSAQFFSRLNKSDAESAARLNAVNQLVQFGNTIDRDLKFRTIKTPMDPLCPGGGLCSKAGFTYTRLIKNGTTEADYNVRVRNECKDMPARMKQLYRTANKNEINLSPAGLNAILAEKAKGAGGTTDVGRCLKAMDCTNGQIMQASFDAPPAAKRPIYPPPLPDAKILEGTKSFAGNVIAFAACAQSIANADRIIMEAVILNEAATPRIEKKEIVIPHGNVANIQMLPSDN